MPEWRPEPTPGPLGEQLAVDRLERVRTEVAPGLPPGEVRRLGDRRRRRTRVAGAAAVAVAVVAVAVPTAILAAGGDGGDVVPAPARTPEIPDDFPIDAGLAEKGGEAVVDGPIAMAADYIAPSLCGADVWPVLGEDGLSVRESGPEYARSRVLVTYDDADAAADVMRGLRAALDDCPTTNDGLGNRFDNAELPPTTDADSLTWSSVLASGQPGGSVYQFVRVGAAVLATADAAEWTAVSARDGATVLTYDNLETVDAMCLFTAGGCEDAGGNSGLSGS